MLVVIISTTSHNFFFFSSRRRHTRCLSDLSSDVCSSDLADRPRPHSSLTYSPRARPVSARLVFQSSRWLRHQHTERSEERRVGKEGSSRRPRAHEQRKVEQERATAAHQQVRATRVVLRQT